MTTKNTEASQQEADVQEAIEKNPKDTGSVLKKPEMTENKSGQAQKKAERQQKSNDLFVVGVGASAGGLDAISKFLSSFNGVDTPCSVVIVMHLSPDYKSELTSILGKRCKWPVVTAENNMPMEARHIYVTPQNSSIHVEDTKLVLEALPQKYSSAPSIDNFLTSLARSKSRKAVGIILSGFGSDGSEGIKAIKSHYGLTIAQLPETAEHKDMPKSAIRTEDVDLTLPAEQMYEEIAQYISNSNTIAQSPPKKKSMDAIFELLEKRSGTDFSQYKPNTIMRRINYRMGNLKLGSLVDYYEMIKNSPRELDVLFETVLIGVTEFFRDTEAFDGLRKHLEILLEDKNPGDSIRIWSVGCATGEEPYSVGILLHELLGSAINQHQVQIFASDIDEKALNFGRKGVYKRESLENMPSELIPKYFEKRRDNHYEISKEIKQHTLFARHDITHDPPFVKLDLIICRNLLIYFNNDLQKQAFQIFHYSLRPKGLLFLGKSESVGVAPDLFTKHDKVKIFRKADAALNYQLRFSRFRNHKSNEDGTGNQQKTRNMGIVDVAKETLYYKFEHPFVIVNGHAEIKEVHGSLRLYLEISQGTMNANLYKMANPELITVLKAQMAQVKKTGVPHFSHLVKFKLYDSDHYVKIRIAPLIYTVGEEQFYLVIFQKVEPGEKMLDLQKKLETEDFVDLRIKELEEELDSTKEHLQIFTEELEATNEELQTINEELQSANEEMKSSNEELETSNEELQSANEELNTANHEMRLANESLIEKEKELKEEKTISERNERIYRSIAENIPNGSVGILNQNFEIEYAAGKGFEDINLVAKELVGQSMPDLNPSKKEAERLRKLCQATLKGKVGEIEVSYDDRYYEIQTVPINVSEDEGTKILYLAQEITEVRKTQMKLQSALEATNLVVFEHDFTKDRIKPNKALNRLFEIRSNKVLSEADIVAKVHPEDVKQRAKNMKRAKKNGRIDHEVRLVLEDEIKHIRVLGNIIFGENKKPISGIATIQDITQDKELLHQIKASEERFKLIADSAPVTIWITDENDRCTYINQTWLEYTGSSLEDCLNNGWLEYIHPEDRRRAIQTFLTASDEREPFELEYMVQDKDGNYGWFLNRAHPMFDKDDRFVGFIGSNVDITEQKQFSKALEKKVAERTEELEEANTELVKLNMNLEEYAYVASHDLQEPVRKIRMFSSKLLDKRNSPDSVEKYGQKIETSAKRMSELIKSVLAYSRLTEDALIPETIDLDEVLEEIRSELELLIKEHKVKIMSDGLGTVPGGRIHLFQLFSNLIRNAVKFNEGQPKITLTATEIEGKKLREEFETADDRVYKKLTLTDNGIGIPEDKLESIFKPFKRLHAKNEYAGTGIGLAICKRIVDLHKGFIKAESEEGKGTTFIIYLPIKP